MKARISKQFRELRKDPLAERQVVRVFMGRHRGDNENTTPKTIPTRQGQVVIRSRPASAKDPA